jgi:hypothetical protein
VLFFGVETNRKQFLTEFTETYANYKNLSIKNMMKWLEYWSNHNKYKFIKEARRSGNDFYFKIIEKLEV